MSAQVYNGIWLTRVGNDSTGLLPVLGAVDARNWSLSRFGFETASSALASAGAASLDSFIMVSSSAICDVSRSSPSLPS